jgi:hypothetical protein
MAYVTPGFRTSIQQHQASIASDKAGECPRREIIQYDEGQLIDAYFAHIHCVTPIIDESDFRSTYSCGGDQRPQWLALLNMVFAMGSISTSEPDEQSHKMYYAKANEYLSFNSLGNGHLETVQALGLLGGYYCHYLNQPNMANVIMDTALRMAVAMALHLEPVSRTIDPTASRDSSSHEARRRVWWSLFCLDAWASLTLGRPSLGRWDKDMITVNLPNSSVSRHGFG